MNQLANLIHGALKGQNNEQRSQCENGLLQLRESNPSQFFSQCAIIITSEASDNFMKQSACTVLGRSAITKIQNNTHTFWDVINQDLRMQIKNSILGTLINSDQEVMRSGANAISQIASLQIPKQQWLDLIDILAQNTMHVDINIKKASIITIKYICQQLKSINAQVNPRSCQQFLGSIIIASRQINNIDFLKNAINALADSIGFLDPILGTKQVRDSAFKIIIDNINNQQLSRSCYQALFEFAKNCYNFLNEYMGFLIEVTIKDMSFRNQQAILAMQFWQSVGAEYIQRKQQIKGRVQGSVQIINHLQDVMPKILSQVMKCMLIKTKSDLDSSDLRQAALKCLSVFSQSCNIQVVNKITEAVQFTLGSEDPGQRQASVLLFSSLCDYPDKNYIESCFLNGFDHMFKLLSDSQNVVVINTLQGFSRLFETFPNAIVTHQNLFDILTTFFTFVEKGNRQICMLSVTILAFMTQRLKDSPNNPIVNDPNLLMTKMVKFYDDNMFKFHQDFRQGNEKVILIIMNIIMAMNDKSTINDLIQFMRNKYYQVIGSNISDLSFLVEGIISIIHTSILALRMVVPNQKQLNDICELINTHIKKFGVEQEGLSLISSMVTTFNKSFKSKSHQYWHYIMQGLEMVDQKPVFKGALTCIGDYGRMFETQFLQKSNYVLNKLFTYIHSNNVQRAQKISIIYCIADLILGMKSYAQSYIDSIIEVCGLCFTAAYEFMNMPNQLQYYEQLKDSLIDLYGCFIFAMNTSRKSHNKLYNHFHELAIFIVRTCDVSLNPTVEYLKNSLYLLFDSAAFYWTNDNYRGKISEIIKSNEVKKLVNTLQNIKNRPDLYDLVEFAHKQMNLVV